MNVIVLCCAAFAAGCGGGGGGGSAVVPPPVTPSPAPSFPASSSATLSAGAQPASANLAPAGNGISATVALAPASSGSAQVSAVLSVAAPAGVPALQSMRRRPAAIGPGAIGAVAYVTLTAPSTVSFATTPAFTFTSPPAFAFIPLDYIALYDASQPANGWTTIAGPATMSGATATFAAAPQVTTLQAGRPYVYAMFAATQTLPTPSPTPTASPTPTPAPANVTFTVTVPAATSAKHRRPAYVSSATQSVRLKLEPNGPSATAACANTCTVALQAPAGNDTFSVALFDGADGTGNVLSRGSTQLAVAPGTTTALAITLGGVPHDALLSLPASIPAGTPTTIPVGVVVHDAQNRVIVGSDPYTDASGSAVTIALSNADTTANGSGAMTLTNATLRTSADASALSYNGGAMTSTTVTARSSALVASASATMSVVPAIAKTIAVGRSLRSVTVGGDGNVWYSENFPSIIGRVSPAAGTYTEFAVPPFNDQPGGTQPTPIDMATARDGSVWFNFESYPSPGGTNDSGVGTIAPNGTLTMYHDPFSAAVFPVGLAAGGDGNIWFAQANGNQVSRITPSGTITSFPVPAAGGWNTLNTIGTGPDGSLWGGGYYYIDHVALDGTVTPFPTQYAHGDGNAYYPDSFAAGSDGNVWFTENTQNGGARQSKVAKITPAGAITEYAIPAPHTAQWMKAGRDGNAWFVDGSGLGSVTPAGVVTFYDVGARFGYFTALTVAPDGNFWLTGDGNGATNGYVVEVVY